jgi:hypothetical protein
MSSINHDCHNGKSSFEYLDRDRAIFIRGDRVYRLSNLSNNRLAGKLIVMIKASTISDNDLDCVDRLNIVHRRSRETFARLVAERWQIPLRVARKDIWELQEQLLMRGHVSVVDSDEPPREFGKSWSRLTTNREAKRVKREVSESQK